MAKVRNFEVIYGKFKVPVRKKINKYYCYSYSSFGTSTATAYTHGCGTGFRFTARTRDFSVHHTVQNGSVTHASSYSAGTEGIFLVGKATGA
jgi:hypothetical protein